jgi:hypothetical protein
MTDRTNYCTSCKGYADRIAALEAENARLRALLLQWDALIKHQYSGSREAMSDMQEAAFATVEAIKAWREVTE